MNVSAVLARRSVSVGHLRATTRFSSTLVVPDNHSTVVDFENGIPVKKVRDLLPAEKQWDFWTTSQSFFVQNPKPSFVGYVQPDETWIVERFGKFSRTLAPGFHLVLPVIDKVKAIKPNVPSTMGIMTRSVQTQGDLVDVYTVAHIEVTDPVTSTYYQNATSAKTDSERGVGAVIQTIVTQELAKLSVPKDSMLSTKDTESITSKAIAAVKAKEGEFGVKLLGLEFRGAFPKEMAVDERLRALEAPMRAPGAPGHGLSADYWADSLPPPYFEKKKYGTANEGGTPATTTLEWCIPSPPDFHHFNMVPKMVAAPLPDAKVGKIAAH